jgi:MFS family permease
LKQGKDRPAVNNSKLAEDVAEVVQPRRLVAAVFAFAIVGATALMIYNPIQSPLTKNWIVTFVVASGLLLLVFWVVPSWTPKINRYLWTASRSVSVTYSASIALVSFFLAILVCVVLFYIGQWWYPTITQHWRALWSVGLVSGLVPLLIVIYLGLVQAGATKLFRWLDAARLLMTPSKDHLNDRGRLFVLVVAAIDIAMIQGGIVLTGGMSVSPFNVLLVLAGSVAAIASERPVYAIFAVILACQAAVATEVIGSYEPPARDFYPAAHIVVFLLSMAVGLLIDLGRKSRPVDSRPSSRRRPPN